MTNFSYANVRAKNGCPICARLLTDDYKTYRDVQEMPNDDLTNMIRLVSDSNKDKDEQMEDVDSKKEPKVPFKLTAIPDRREGVLKSTAESVISSFQQ